MGLAALKGKKSKKKIARSRARTGVNGAPIEKGFDAVKDYFHMNVDKKDCISQVKTWVKKNFPEPSKYILLTVLDSATKTISRLQILYDTSCSYSILV